ncbi:MAG: 4Fe-4S dicluster domain-containing protein [Pseudomonadota bacterium]|nr:4Fe-4S dicluster domain-containing protein [Pseudomonadota bacterium]
MQLGDSTVLVCDCAGTMPLDGAAIAKACGAESCAVSRMLCREQIGKVATAARASDRLVIACTQEGAAFFEAIEEAGLDVAPKLVNIRENAGWSEEAERATPKIAALLQEATLKAPDVPTVEMPSSGICLVYGAGQVALDAARQLDGRMTVSLLLTDMQDLMPLGVMDLMTATGRIAAAEGHLGDFEINVDSYAPLNPASRDALSFGRATNGAAAKCDVILDLSGRAPLFPTPERRDGYLRADPADPVAVQKAIFAASDLVGEFEKPRYVAFRSELCAHSRSRVTGCTRCLDVCPASAIQPDGESVAIDPYLCGGCGSCNSVCPTQAASYAYPADRFLAERTRTLLSTYLGQGGKRPILVVHASEHGGGLIDAMARFGKGLPARAIPFAVHETTQINAEFLMTAFAFGAERIVLLVGDKRRAEIDGLAQQAGLAEAILTGLGYDSGLVEVLVTDDPDTLETALWDARKPKRAVTAAASFLPQPEKRTNMRLATDHLRKSAPDPSDHVSLPPGSAFGRLRIDADNCTLCLSCVGACPTNALTDNPDKPQLGFQESACIQCGLCKNTCPEKVIALEPRYRFGEGANEREIVKEEDPFECISCGKPFAAKSTIEKMIATLGGKHWMFQGAGADRLKMCEDCRVEAVFNDEPHLAAGGRPMPRTTDDYLAARDRGEEDLD